MSEFLGKGSVLNSLPFAGSNTWRSRPISPREHIVGTATKSQEGQNIATNWAFDGLIWLTDITDQNSPYETILALHHDGQYLLLLTSHTATTSTKLYRLNPLTGQNVGSVNLGSIGSVMVSQFHKGYDYVNDQPSGPSLWLFLSNGSAVRVNTNTLAFTTPFPASTFTVVGGGVHTVSAMDSVFMGAQVNTFLYRVRDPGIGAPTFSTISLAGTGTPRPIGMTWSGSNIHVVTQQAFQTFGLERIDPLSGTSVTQRNSVAVGAFTPNIGWDGTGLWFFQPRNFPSTGYIIEIDPITLATVQQHWGLDPAIAFPAFFPDTVSPYWAGSTLLFVMDTSYIVSWDPTGFRAMQFFDISSLGLDPFTSRGAQFDTADGSSFLILSGSFGGSSPQYSNKFLLRFARYAPRTYAPRATQTVETVAISSLLADSDRFVAVTAAPVTITLPVAPTKSRRYTVKDANGLATVANPITVSGNGINIDGAATRLMKTAYETLELVYNGSVWSVV